MGSFKLLAFTLLAWASFVLAFDPSPLQDFCVAVDSPIHAVFVNGRFCKDPSITTADDFFLQGFNIPGNTSNHLGSLVTFATVAQLPGLNTLGVSLVRIDIEPGGVNPPHIHPRSGEILTVLEGILYAGFITSNPDHRLFTKVLLPGDVFVFPVGLIHFQYNVGGAHAVAHAALSSQNPGVIWVANTVFGANPPILDDALVRAFRIEKKLVRDLQAQFREYPV